VPPDVLVQIANKMGLQKKCGMKSARIIPSEHHSMILPVDSCALKYLVFNDLIVPIIVIFRNGGFPLILCIAHIKDLTFSVARSFMLQRCSAQGWVKSDAILYCAEAVLMAIFQPMSAVLPQHFPKIFSHFRCRHL
jgi:hypothetical protein